MILDIANGIIGLIDKIIPDEKAREQAKLNLLQAEGQQELEKLKASMSAILSEAQSADPWTSRARPSFMYVMYLIMLLCIIGSIIGIWFPAEVKQASVNMGDLFKAIPGDLYWLFGAGYLGYTGARTYEKSKGVTK